jgi:hypothetical protein
MMRALVGLAICYGGCVFEHGTVADDDDNMGSGSGSGSGSSSLDTDGDGKSDLTDNCPTVNNADQRNHDMDDRGDACDVCPHVIDIGKDTDGDGVGDGCDPRPTSGGDRIAFFEGFYDPVSWVSIVGQNTWQAIADGTLRQPSMTSAYQLVRDDTPNLGAVFVDVRVKINAVSTNNSSPRSTGIVLSHRDENHFVFCGIAASNIPLQDSEVQAGQVTTGLFGAHYDYAPGAFPAQMAGDWLTLQAKTSTVAWGNTRIECVTHRAGTTGTAAFEGDADIEGDVGIRTNGADASFDYVFVVAIGT